MIQTKENEIFYSEGNDKAICFFDLLERKSIKKIYNINKRIESYDWFKMISENYLLFLKRTY